MRTKLVAGNWKMNGSLSMAQDLSAAIARDPELASIAKEGDLEVVIFPPSPYFMPVIKETLESPVKVGAQNVSSFGSGAYTGEISTDMLVDLNVSSVLLGHSERRAYFSESDQLVFDKLKKALSSGLTVFLCVGETLEQRKAGQAEQTVSLQLNAALELLEESDWQRIVVAYEPVWAIGTGETATPSQAQDMHAFIRGLLKGVSIETADRTRILYGGSVKAENASELFAQPDIDGGLIGGASLNAEDFISICKSAVAD